MAEELPSDDALTDHYLHTDVDITIDNDGVPGTTEPYASATGTIVGVRVDGEDGVYLTIDCFVPVEDIPDL